MGLAVIVLPFNLSAIGGNRDSEDSVAPFSLLVRTAFFRLLWFSFRLLSQGSYHVAFFRSMSNSTLARIGMIPEEFKPGRFSEFARTESASEGREVSGVSVLEGKEWDDADRFGDFIASSEVDDEVEGDGWGGPKGGESELTLVVFVNNCFKGVLGG